VPVGINNWLPEQDCMPPGLASFLYLDLVILNRVTQVKEKER